MRTRSIANTGSVILGANCKKLAFHHAPDPTLSQAVTVEYSILLSPTYRVPVLYIHLRDLPPTGPTGIDAAYQYLVPQRSQPELLAEGVMGGLSMTVREPAIEDVEWSIVCRCGLTGYRTTRLRIFHAISSIRAGRRRLCGRSLG